MISLMVRIMFSWGGRRVKPGTYLNWSLLIPLECLNKAYLFFFGHNLATIKLAFVVPVVGFVLFYVFPLCIDYDIIHFTVLDNLALL